MSPLKFLRALRTLMGPLWWYSALLFVVSRIGDLVNLYVGAFLVPAFVPERDLGAVRPLLLFAGLAATPIAWLVLPAEKYLNVFAERGELGKAKSLLRDALTAVAAVSLAVLALLLAFPRQILVRLRVEDPRLLGFVAVLATLASLRPVLAAGARALRRFDAVVLSGLPPPFVRWAAFGLLMRAWPLHGYLTAQVLCDAAGLAVLATSLAWHVREAGPAVSYRPHLREMARYAAPLLAYDLVTRLQAPVEALVVRQRLPELVSAADYLVQTFAMLPSYFGDAVAVFLFPLISARHERGAGTHRMLGQSMAVTALIGLGSAAALAVVAPWLFGLRIAWQIALPYAGLVAWAALGRACRMTLHCFILHEHACRRFGYLRYYAPCLLLQTGGLYALAGWGAFAGVLPEAVWRAVEAWPRLTLGFVVGWSVVWQALTLALALAHLALRQRRARQRRRASG